MNVKVPAALLRDPGLPATAKLLWMCIPLTELPHNPDRLAARCRLAPRTVHSGLRALARAGWLPHTARPAEPHASVPARLLLDKHLNYQAKLLYATLQLTSGFCDGAGEATYRALCEVAGASLNTVRPAAQLLQEAGWLVLEQAHKLTPVRFELKNPHAAKREEALDLTKRRLDRGEHEGETIMQELLTALVECDDFDDNVTPGYLVNPYNGEELQLDRHYIKRRIAFEFQGPQHFGPTNKYPDPEKALKQQVRDHIKEAMCRRNGIHLVTVVADELSVEAMTAKVRGLLPLRDLDDDDPVLAHLRKVCDEFQERVWLARIKERK